MKMKYIKFAIWGLLTVFTIACSNEELERANYVSFQGKNVELITPATGSGNAEFKIYATTVSSVDRTFTIQVDELTTADEATYTVPGTVTIPANSNVGTFVVQSDAINIGKKIAVKFAADPSTIVGSSMTIGVYEECLENLLFMDMLFDDYPEEFAWEITDSNGNFVVGKDFGEYEGLATTQVRERICLPAGTFTLAVLDFYGDGMYDGSNTGNFALKKVADGSTIATASGNFGASVTVEFTLD